MQLFVKRHLTEGILVCYLVSHWLIRIWFRISITSDLEFWLRILNNQRFSYITDMISLSVTCGVGCLLRALRSTSRRFSWRMCCSVKLLSFPNTCITASFHKEGRLGTIKLVYSVCTKPGKWAVMKVVPITLATPVVLAS